MLTRHAKPPSALIVHPDDAPGLQRRIVSRSRRDGLGGGCWLVVGYTDDGGYGQIKLCGKSHWIHRVSYAAFNGPLAAGTTVHHRCQCTSCVNPTHLEELRLNRHNNGAFR